MGTSSGRPPQAPARDSARAPGASLASRTSHVPGLFVIATSNVWQWLGDPPEAACKGPDRPAAWLGGCEAAGAVTHRRLRALVPNDGVSSPPGVTRSGCASSRTREPPAAGERRSAVVTGSRAPVGG